MVNRQMAPPSKLGDQGDVLSNAARLFREKGFERTSLKEIAEACHALYADTVYLAAHSVWLSAVFGTAPRGHHLTCYTDRTPLHGWRAICLNRFLTFGWLTNQNPATMLFGRN